MKKILFILVFISLSAQAEDLKKCLNEAVRMTLALKIKQVFSDGLTKLHEARPSKEGNFVNPYSNDKLSTHEACKDAHGESVINYDGAKSSRLKTVKMILEHQDPNKIPLHLTNSLFMDNSEKGMSAKEICQQVEDEKKNLGNGISPFDGESNFCDQRKQTLDHVTNTPYENLSAAEACEKFGNFFRESYKAQEACEEELNKTKASRTEAPGEEIPGAEEAPKTSPGNTNHPQSTTKPYQRRKTENEKKRDEIERFLKSTKPQ